MIEKAFLTVKEVSQMINLGRTKTYEAVRAGRIPKVVIEGCIRVPAAALRDWIAERSALETSETGGVQDEPRERATVPGKTTSRQGPTPGGIK